MSHENTNRGNQVLVMSVGRSSQFVTVPFVGRRGHPFSVQKHSKCMTVEIWFLLFKLVQMQVQMFSGTYYFAVFECQCCNFWIQCSLFSRLFVKSFCMLCRFPCLVGSLCHGTRIILCLIICMWLVVIDILYNQYSSHCVCCEKFIASKCGSTGVGCKST